jgi:very-short-patch-repair endonuclease
MTLPEALLWRELKKRPDGLKFRHQHRAGPYFLDFYCYEATLAVEVDGEVHGRGDQPERDAIRDEWLRLQNVRVLRINASDVLRDMDAVIRHIVDVARG